MLGGHPNTLTSMNNVALALSGQGECAEAEKMHRVELALREKVSGKEHPHTDECLLPCLLADQRERYEDALPLHQRAYTGYMLGTMVQRGSSFLA